MIRLAIVLIASALTLLSLSLQAKDRFAIIPDFKTAFRSPSEFRTILQMAHKTAVFALTSRVSTRMRCKDARTANLADLSGEEIICVHRGSDEKRK